MAKRNARVRWFGTPTDGTGRIVAGSGTFDVPYTVQSRVDGTGANPEEMLGGAHAGCFTMALSSLLTAAGHPPTELATTATVHLRATSEGYRIPRIDLEVEGTVAGVTEERFVELAQEAKATCPVSLALAGLEITLAARLVGEADIRIAG